MGLKFEAMLGMEHGLRRATGANEEVRVVLEDHAVSLPEVEVVGLQAVERLLEHLQSQRPIAAMRANPGHQENLVAFAAKRGAHPAFRLAAVVFPAVVKEGYAAIDGRVRDADGGLLVVGRAQVMSTEAKGRNADIGVLPERPRGD
jgi:hypothetical protein